MVRDAVRGYWALASGLTEVTRQKATAAARALVGQGEATAEQVGAIAEDLISTSLSNRAALANVVRFEVDRARSAIGVVTSAELEALSRRVTALEAQLADLAASTAVTPANQASGTKPGRATSTAKATTMAKATKAAKATKTANATKTAKPTKMAKATNATTTAKTAKTAKTANATTTAKPTKMANATKATKTAKATKATAATGRLSSVRS